MAIFSQNLDTDSYRVHPIVSTTDFASLKYAENRSTFNRFCTYIWIDCPYMILPYGFGFIFHDLLAKQMKLAGLTIDMSDIPKAMVIPVIGLFYRIIIAIFISYRKPREYENRQIE